MALSHFVPIPLNNALLTPVWAMQIDRKYPNPSFGLGDMMHYNPSTSGLYSRVLS